MAAPRNKQVYNIALSGLLVALMLVLGYVESLIPLNAGIPGIKLGLANGVLVFAVYLLGGKPAFILMLVKVVLSGLLFGGVNTMMYSLAGGLMSMAGMVLVHRVKGVSAVGVSIAGGVLHNVGQVALAMLVLQTPQLISYMAVLVLVGLGTGAVTGVIATLVMKHFRKIRL